MTRLYYKGDGGLVPITKMFDIDGDEIDDPDMATSVTCHEHGVVYWTVEVDAGDIIRK